MYELYSLPASQRLIEKHFHFDEENVPHIKDIMKNISVTFVTGHYSLGYIKPELPNIVNVAGLHFTPAKSLLLVRFCEYILHTDMTSFKRNV